MASEGKVKLEIKYCVSWGYFWKAASVAAELSDGRVRETSIALTPVGDGRFEIYINDEKVYDRLEAGEGDFLPSQRKIREAKQTLIKELEAVPT